MLEQKKADELLIHFQRIFSLPITRSSFREIQNVILSACDKDVNKANSFLDALLNKDVKSKATYLLDLINHYSVPTRVAKQVQDMGDVLSMLTSDVGIRGSNIIFSVRIRRIDGTEFHFITETDGVLHFVEHFLVRLEEASKTEHGKDILAKHKDRLQNVLEHLNKLLS